MAAHARPLPFLYAADTTAASDSTAAKLEYPVDSVFQAKINAILDSIYAEQNYLMSAADSSIYVPWRDTIVYMIDSTLLPKLTQRDSSDSLADQVLPAFPDSVLVKAMVVDTVATKLLRDSLDVLYNSFWQTDTLSMPLMDSLMRAYSDALGSNLPDAKDIKRAIRKNKQDYRDSVIQHTPRILETFVVPDSLYYKQMLIWTHSQFTNDIALQKRDTSCNYNFYDNPALKDDADAIYLGTMGSALQRTNFFKRETLKEASFFDPYLIYTYTPETLPMYNTKSPFTEMAYWGNPFSSKQKEESSVKILSTQNITPSLNLTLEYRQFGGTGDLTGGKTNVRTSEIGLNYLGKKYEMNAAYLATRVKNSENGGVSDVMWVRDTTIDTKAIPVNLQSADNLLKRRTVFITQSLSIPMNFLRKDKDELALGEGTVAYIGHSLEFSKYSKVYSDAISTSDNVGRSFYFDRFNLSQTASHDSISVRNIDNKFFLTLQPFSNDALLSKVTGGFGYQIMNYYGFKPEYYVKGNRNETSHNTYFYGKAQGMLKQYINWDAFARIYTSGYYLGDLEVAANLALSVYPIREGIHLKLHGETRLQEPGYYEQNLYFNHHNWNNNFEKTSKTKLEGSIEIPYTQTKLSVGYALIDNMIYYDSTSVVRQFKSPVHTLAASLEQNVRLWAFHFDHKIVYQMTSNDEVLPLPKLTANIRYYVQFPIVKNVLEVQVGANAVFYTKYFIQSYSPDLGVFYNQRTYEWGNNPYIDLFINAQWKTASIFVKYTDAFDGFLERGYFSAANYIRPSTAFKFGITWPFYVK
ncbi:MAG: putative porin [Bacteroidales bacterium]|nr:putative porin [Bacteroidales bacterium]